MQRRSILALLALATLAVVQARDVELKAPADLCQSCLVSVRILEDFLCDPAATDFLIDFVEKRVCPAVGDQEQCHNLAEGLLPMLIQWFRASATPASLCSAAGVCSASILSIPKLNTPSARVKDGAQCALCEFVVTRVKVAVNDPQTMEKVKEVALKVCGDLPSELSDTCTDFVDTYEPMFAQLIEEMDPQTVCGLMGMCMEGLVAAAPLSRPLPEGLVRGLAAMRSLRAEARPDATLLALRGPSNDACDYCKMAVIEAHSLVANPSVQAEVLNYTLAVCENFPSFADACKAYVAEYAPLVFGLLEQYLIPDVLCTQIGMCPPSRSAATGTTSTVTLLAGLRGSGILLSGNVQRIARMDAREAERLLGGEQKQQARE